MASSLTRRLRIVLRDLTAESLILIVRLRKDRAPFLSPLAGRGRRAKRRGRKDRATYLSPRAGEVGARNAPGEGGYHVIARSEATKQSRGWCTPPWIASSPSGSSQ
jgi:hypothetical protein